jgi:hypothetical protein
MIGVPTKSKFSIELTYQCHYLHDHQHYISFMLRTGPDSEPENIMNSHDFIKHHSRNQEFLFKLLLTGSTLVYQSPRLTTMLDSIEVAQQQLANAYVRWHREPFWGSQKSYANGRR